MKKYLILVIASLLVTTFIYEKANAAEKIELSCIGVVTNSFMNYGRGDIVIDPESKQVNVVVEYGYVDYFAKEKGWNVYFGDKHFYNVHKTYAATDDDSKFTENTILTVGKNLIKAESDSNGGVRSNTSLNQMDDEHTTVHLEINRVNGEFVFRRITNFIYADGAKSLEVYGQNGSCKKLTHKF